jgi:DUF1016 N-terminal domain
MTSKRRDLQQKASKSPIMKEDLLKDLRSMIEKTQQSVSSTVNASLTLLYWHVGNRIHKEILQQSRAGYGKEIVVTLSRQLVLDYGNGFNEKNLRRMIQFVEEFPDERIVVSLIRQLSWSHFVALIPIKDHLQGIFMPRCAVLKAGSTDSAKQN